MNYTIIDIETMAKPESELNIPEFEASKVLKDPEKIKMDLEKKKADFLDSCALRAEHGKILVIGMLEGDGRFHIVEDYEHLMLEFFWKKFSENEHVMVGHYIKGFDIPFLMRRSWLLEVKVPHGVMNGRYLNQRFLDTMEAWSCGTRDTISLDNLSKAFGLPGKSGNGKDFSDLYSKDREKALEYLSNDLKLTRDCAKKMNLI